MNNENVERELSEEELHLFENFLKVMDPALQYPIESRLANGCEQIMLAISLHCKTAACVPGADALESNVGHSSIEKL